MIEENIRQKILSLVARSGPLTVAPTGIARDTRHLNQCQGWITEALNVIQLAVPIPNNLYRQGIERIGRGSSGHPQRVGSIAEIFQALLGDVDAGLVSGFSNETLSLEQTRIKVFISHSSKDVALAVTLINLIRKALTISASDIRCTSVPGYKLPGGAKTESQLREELLAAPVFIGLVTEASSSSVYVLIELGARWGANRELIPLMAPGISPEVLEGPISGINALSCGSAADLHSLIAQIAKILGTKTEPAASYQDDLEIVTKFPVAKLPQASVSPVAQSTVDALAEIRAEAVGEILNCQVTTDAELAALASYANDWYERVEKILQKAFSRAEQLNFTRLGAVPNVIFPHAYNDAHAKILREYALQERRLLDIITRHTR